MAISEAEVEAAAWALLRRDPHSRGLKISPGDGVPDEVMQRYRDEARAALEAAARARGEGE